MNCPDEQALQLLVSSPSTGDHDSEIAQHFESCEACQNRVENWLQSTDTPTAQFIDETQDSIEDEFDSGWLASSCTRIASKIRKAVRPDVFGSQSIPQGFGDYELIKVLGEGGMGTVYLAQQSSLNRRVAIKIVSQGRFTKRSFVERFFYEAESAAMLDHPGIVPIYDVGEAQGMVYYAMAYIPGGNLAEYLSKGPMGSRSAAKSLRIITAAIAHAHEKGVIHRDLKPANILLDDRGEPRVADFGLAKQVESAASLTITGEVLGTPSYMPPEQARLTDPEITVTGDVYSLGAILFHMLTGRPPFVAVEPIDVLHQLIHEDPISPRKLNPSVHRDLDTIALKCLSKAPQKRYGSAIELAEELDRFLNGRPILARPTGPVDRVWRWCGRNRAVAALTAGIFALMIASTLVSASLGMLATRRADELEQSNDSLLIAKGDLKTAVNNAEEQARLATQQADSVARILEKILFTMQAPLRQDAAAQGVRREMLDEVLSELEQLPDGLVLPDRILRCRASAMVSLADVATQNGSLSGVASSQGSAKLYLDAINLFEGIHARSPNDPRAIKDLAKAYHALGSTYADDHVWKDAHKFLRMAVEHYQQFLESVPGDFKAAVLLAESELELAESLRNVGTKADARALYLVGYHRISKLQQQDPTDRLARGVLYRASHQLGIFYTATNELDQADKYLDESVRVSESLANDFPLDYDTLMNVSSAYEYAGKLSMRLGRLDEACHRFEESLKWCIDLGKAAPNNHQIQWDVSFSYQALADGYLAAGKLDKAEENAKICIKMRQRLVSNAPKLAIRTTKLNHVLVTLAKVYRRQSRFDDAISCYAEAIEACHKFDTLAKTTRFAKQTIELQKQRSQTVRMREQQNQ